MGRVFGRFRSGVERGFSRVGSDANEQDFWKADHFKLKTESLTIESARQSSPFDDTVEPAQATVSEIQKKIEINSKIFEKLGSSQQIHKQGVIE